MASKQHEGTAAKPGHGSPEAEDFEIRDFAEKHGLTTDEVRELVARRAISVRFPISGHKG